MVREELIIGIAVRNEEGAIIPFMNSLVQAVKSLSHTIVYETIVCINGSSDNSFKILLEMQQNIYYNVLNFKIIQSDEDTLVNLLRKNSALCQICKYQKEDDPAKLYGINDDSQNHFSLCVSARKRGVR